MPFPGYPFDSMEGCITEFEDDPDIDDAGAFCTWLHPEEPSEMSAKDFGLPETVDPDEFRSVIQEEMRNEQGSVGKLLAAIKQGADAVLNSMNLSLVSAVETPAQPSSWVMMKDAEKGHDWRTSVPIVKQLDREKRTDGEEKRIAYAPALVPNQVDKQGDVVPAFAIEEAAHKFLKTDGGIDEQHNLIEGSGEVVESWVLKQGTEFELPSGETESYPAGTWMLGVQFKSDTWEKVKQGELTGFSIYGEAEEITLKYVEKNTRDKGNFKGGSETTEKQGSDTMNDERYEELTESQKEISDSLNTLEQTFTEAVNELKDAVESSDPEEEKQEDGDEDEGDVVQDALGMLAEALDVPVADLQDAIEGFMKQDNDDEDDEDDGEEEKQNTETEPETEPEAKQKGHDSKVTPRDASSDTEKSQGISFQAKAEETIKEEL